MEFSTSDKDNKILEEKINKLEIEINKIYDKLEKIKFLLNNNIIPSCSKMSSHIDFIEIIYEKLKYPIEIISNKFNYINYFSKKSIEKI